jgi:hypothetical protein
MRFTRNDKGISSPTPARAPCQDMVTPLLCALRWIYVTSCYIGS